MSYESVDALQRTLTASVFQYAADKKKAAGRALGTLVEIVTFHTLRTWDLRDNIVIGWTPARMSRCRRSSRHTKAT